MRDTEVAIHLGKKGTPEYIILLTFDYKEEGENWVGICVELGTSTFAASLKEVQKELREAVSLQLNEVEQMGFMKEDLAEHNVQAIPLSLREEGSEPGFTFARQ